MHSGEMGDSIGVNEMRGPRDPGPEASVCSRLSSCAPFLLTAWHCWNSSPGLDLHRKRRTDGRRWTENCIENPMSMKRHLSFVVDSIQPSTCYLFKEGFFLSHQSSSKQGKESSLTFYVLNIWLLKCPNISICKLIIYFKITHSTRNKIYCFD